MPQNAKYQVFIFVWYINYDFRSIFFCPYSPQISDYLWKKYLDQPNHQSMLARPYNAIGISMRHLYKQDMTTGFDILIFSWSTDTKFSQQGKNVKKFEKIFSSVFKNDSIIFQMLWPFHDQLYYTILSSKKETCCSFINILFITKYNF